MRSLLYISILFVLPILTLQAGERPNFVIIMVDDLGFSDIGCYGSEIETPNLDRLASNGLRFSQFYNTAKCNSSRVSLLSGQYYFAAGQNAMTHTVTSAEVLREGGYFTAMSGKWHIDKEPMDFGFERYFGHLSGSCNYFWGDRTFRLNDKPWKVPDSDFYTTVTEVDYALKFLEESRKAEKPFYLYLAFNAPHAPLHALPEDYKKYLGRYDAGWDNIRDARIARQKALGIIPEDLKPSPRPPHIAAWKDLVPWQRDYEINRMVTLAAMIDRLDQEIGRLIAYLEKTEQLNNTFILFISDNGACPYDRRKAPLLHVEPTNGATWFGDSTGWAWARNAPFRFYKQNQFEGGISSPGIVHWPAGLKTAPGAIVDTPVHLIDVLPTLADLSKSKIPSTFAGRDLHPVSGVSLRPILEAKEFTRPDPIHLQFATDFGLRDGDWKLVSFKGQEWELYNMADDRTELNNLAEAKPERLQSMAAKWREMAHSVLHVERYANFRLKPAVIPRKNRQWTRFIDPDRPEPIRARKNTRLKKQDHTLELTFTGEDPGIAMDLRESTWLPTGPYQLSFTITTEQKATGELFYTTDDKTPLSDGDRLHFSIAGDGTPEDISILIKTPKSLRQLRLDLSDGPGEATISDLKLLDPKNAILINWLNAVY